MTKECQHIKRFELIQNKGNNKEWKCLETWYFCSFFAVLDMNDNPPKFEQPSYTCFLSEHAQRGQFVTVVTASDPDYVDHERLVYTIVGGNEQQTFSIDPTTGNLHLKL
jgi:hypothetical protein